MDVVASHPVAANDRCTVSRATQFHQTHLKYVLDAAALAGTSVPVDFLAAKLLSEQVVFLAYANDRPIGCIMAMSGRITVLHGLFVLPDERAKGHGSELIRSAISAFDSAGGTKTFWTAVDPALLGASDRFIKFGFEAVQELCEDGLQLLARSAAQPLESSALFKPTSVNSGLNARQSLQTASAS